MCDYSAWTYSANPSSRSDVPSALNEWIKTFVEPNGFKVDRTRMNNTGEQISMKMKDFLSSANSFASNDVAEHRAP